MKTCIARWPAAGYIHSCLKEFGHDGEHYCCDGSGYPGGRLARLPEGLNDGDCIVGFLVQRRSGERTLIVPDDEEPPK